MGYYGLMEKLFVYGTLLFEDEEPSHGVNAKQHIRETKLGWVKGKLYVVEGFPFLVPGGDKKVKGKLFFCEDIEPLIKKYDRIEGANQSEPFFERKKVEVELDDGEKEEAFCYIGGRKLQDCFAKPEYLIESGEWMNIE